VNRGERVFALHVSEDMHGCKAVPISHRKVVIRMKETLLALGALAALALYTGNKVVHSLSRFRV